MSNPAPKAAPRPAAEPDEPVATEDGVLRSDVVAELTKLRGVRNERDALTAEETERLANVRDAVRDLPKGEYTDEAGRKVLTLSRPQSWDQATAEKAIPAPFRPLVTRRVPNLEALDAALADGTITAEVYERLTTPVLDKALAKENLPPKVYNLCLVAAANPTIKPVDPSKVPAQRAGGGR